MKIENRAFTIDELKIISQSNEDFEEMRIMLDAALSTKTADEKDYFLKLAIAEVEQS